MTVLYGLLTAPLLAALLLQLAAALQAAATLVLAAARPPNILRTVNSSSADSEFCLSTSHQRYT